MTRLVRIPLGTAPGSGKQSIDLCTALKRQLRSVLPTPHGAALITVTEHGTARVEAVCPSESREWAERAGELAPEVWATLAVRRKERVR